MTQLTRPVPRRAFALAVALLCLLGNLVAQPAHAAHATSSVGKQQQVQTAALGAGAQSGALRHAPAAVATPGAAQPRPASAPGVRADAESVVARTGSCTAARSPPGSA